VNGTAGILAVVNPCTLRGTGAPLWAAAVARLPDVDCLMTVGDGADRQRITAALAAQRPSLVIAAGGDGTLRAVVSAVLEQEHASAPAVAIAPLGTGNNVARALGLRGFRQDGNGAVERAVAAIRDGHECRIDVGRVGGEVFVGSFAAGMDGAILALRNRWRRRAPFGAQRGGYALYLLSCAANLARHRCRAGRVEADDVLVERPLYNVVVTNTALYAGEFRFDDGGDHSADGRLDLNVFSSAGHYVQEFVVAWRRHLRHGRGLPVHARPALRRVARVALAFDRPVPAQLDGEEYPAAARFEIEVVPQVLRVRVPA